MTSAFDCMSSYFSCTCQAQQLIISATHWTACACLVSMITARADCSCQSSSDTGGHTSQLDFESGWHCFPKPLWLFWPSCCTGVDQLQQHGEPMQHQCESMCVTQAVAVTSKDNQHASSYCSWHNEPYLHLWTTADAFQARLVQLRVSALLCCCVAIVLMAICDSGQH